MAIQSFRHTGLEQFAKQGCTAGIQALHASRLNQLISQLSFSGGVTESLKSLPGFHSVKRKYRNLNHEIFAVRVDKSWRLTFQVEDSGAISGVNYVQYH